MREHQVRAVRAAYLVCRDVGLSEDVVQSAFVRVYERIRRFDEARDFALWFMRIVVNDATKAAMRRSKTAPVDGRDGEYFVQNLKDGQTLPDESLVGSELREQVWEALAKLPPKQRAVIVQRYYLGMSEAEMSGSGSLPRGINREVATARGKEEVEGDTEAGRLRVFH